MAISPDTRLLVRERYAYRCGYCGVDEVSTGNELEIDHFQPQSFGGTEAWDNLVYACSACNRYKSNYWHKAEAPEHFRLLHPLRDDIKSHIIALPNGYLRGLTPQGAFQIELLRLNRPQLIAHRRKAADELRKEETTRQLKVVNAQFQIRLDYLEQEIQQITERIRRLPDNQ